MIEIINDFSLEWSQWFARMVLQNSLFLVLVLLLLMGLRNKSPHLLRIIALVSLFKLFLPPLIPLPLTETTPVFTRIPEIFVLSDITAAAALPAAAGPVKAALSLASLFMLLWLAIGLYILAAGILQWLRLRKVVCNLESINTSAVIPGIEMDGIPVYKSDALHSPMLTSWFKACIIMPANWHTMKRKEQKTILLHELAHVRQKDHWINLLLLFVIAFHYFNPLVWLLARRLRHYSELICDDRTVKEMNQEPAAYSKSLLSISELLVLPDREVLTGACFSETFHAVKRRISYQLQQQEGKTMRLNHWQKAVTLTTMIIIFIFSSLQGSKKSPEKIVSGQLSILEDKIYSEDEVDKMALPKEGFLDGVYQMLKQSNKGEFNGELKFLVVVNNNGTVDTVKSIKSIPALKDVFESDLKKWQWQPAEVKGQPVICSRICDFIINSDYSISFSCLPGMNNETEKIKDRQNSIKKNQTESDEIFEFFQVSEKPKVIKTVTPEYPDSARKANIEGKVVVTVTIGKDGKVENAVIFASDTSMLNEAALEAAKQFVFTPAVNGDKRVRVRMNLPFNFKLKN